MTYASFLAVFLGLPLAVAVLVTAIDARRGRPVAAPEAVALAAHVVIAVAYTTPWDNYLVATRAWWYDPDRVLGITLGWVPLEEYAFFVLQTLLTGLVLLALRRRVRPARPLRPSGRLRAASAAAAFAGAALAAAVLFAGWRPGTYLALILVWALPPIALQLAVGADVLWHERRTVLTVLSSAALYLSAADALAIHDGVWTIDPGQSTGWLIGGTLPVEEFVFFVVTNALVVSGMTLALAPATWDRWRRVAPARRAAAPSGRA